MLVTLGSACGPASTDEPERDPLDLILVSLDTVRPDHLGLYGYNRQTSPALDHLARRSVVFERAMAPVPLTGPSHASVFTGRQPWSRHGHGLRKNGLRLHDSVPSLAEVLQDAGWRTAAFVSGFPLTDPLCGLGRGFDVYDDEVENLRRPGNDTLAAALDWWRGTERGNRFLFLHLHDVHGPYLVSDALARRFESDKRGPWNKKVPRYQRRIDPKTGGLITNLRHYVDRYDAAVYATDDQLRRLVAEVNPEHTVILVISDHGETLDGRAHPLDHGSRLYEEQMRAVAVLATPDLEPARVDALVSLADFGPTLLDLVGFGPHALGRHRSPTQGRSLRPLLESQRDEWRPWIRMSTTANIQVPKQRRLGLEGPQFLAGLVDAGGWKLIVYPGPDPAHELYRLGTDPLEHDNLASSRTEQLHRLESVLLKPGDEILRPEMETLEIDPEADAALRALGYVAN